jgi:hypothetical protein
MLPIASDIFPEIDPQPLRPIAITAQSAPARSPGRIAPPVRHPALIRCVIRPDRHVVRKSPF